MGRIVRVFRSNHSSAIILPKGLADGMGFVPGVELLLTVVDNRTLKLELQPKPAKAGPVVVHYD